MTDPEYRANWKERRAVGLVLLWSAVGVTVVAVLTFSMLGRRRALQRRIDEVNAALASFETESAESSLGVRIAGQRERRAYLLDEWARYSNLLETWKNAETVEGTEGAGPARIDFKVALFNAKRRLREKAVLTGTELPEGLGVSEMIATDEDASVRLLQLAAVEKLVGFAVDLKVPVVSEIEALPPRPVPVADGGAVYLDQYPVRIRLQCSLEDLTEFLARVARARHFFTVGHLMAQKASLKEADLLNVTVVFRALILKETPPGQEG